MKIRIIKENFNYLSLKKFIKTKVYKLLVNCIDFETTKAILNVDNDAEKHENMISSSVLYAQSQTSIYILNKN